VPGNGSRIDEPNSFPYYIGIHGGVMEGWTTKSVLIEKVAKKVKDLTETKL
jgi:hypothetical protein